MVRDSNELPAHKERVRATSEGTRSPHTFFVCGEMTSNIASFCSQNPAQTYYIAYSGGVDSHALLSMLVKARESMSINLCAIHINHGLSPNASAWEKHCAAICEELKVEFISRKISINTENGASLEAAAREQRYKAFAEYVKPGDMLLTAHHQDDQAETFLLQLLRGAGVKGLSAMPVIKSFAQAQHARPLLNFSRAEILGYASENKLNWIEDESNDNKKFMRNFVRHDLLPALAEREPAAAELIARSAAHCAEAQSLLDEFAATDLKQCIGSRENTLSVAALNQLTPARQRLVLRHWILKNNFPLPDHRRLESILSDVLTAAHDRMPLVTWGDVSLRRYGDDLFVMLSSPHTQNVCGLPVPPDVVRTRFVCAGNATNNVTIKYRADISTVTIPGRGKQTLKNLFQEWRVPPWERDHVPLLFINDELVKVEGYYLHPDYN